MAKIGTTVLSLDSKNGQLFIYSALEKAETIKQRLKKRFAHLQPSSSLAVELISERREEAKREASE